MAAQIIDELEWNDIKQLHSATLKISGQSFEVKKFCVTVEIAALTLLSKFTREEISIYFFILGGIIPFLFWFLDSVTYYYQDKLRGIMITSENNIRRRNSIPLKPNNHIGGSRVVHSVFNNSQWLYVILLLLDLAVFLWLHFNGQIK